METKSIPTVEQFLDDYFKEINPNFNSYKKAIELLSAAGRHEVIRIRTSQAAHEYAVLFAKYHRERQIEAIDKLMNVEFQGCFCPTISDIENAYKEDLIK